MNTKIYIIGGLGSGKSFFAKKLLDKTGIEYFDMDRIVFKEGSFEQRDEKERDNIFENTTNKDHWILEGTFTESWITPGLGEASQIIYLTTHPLIRFYRFIKRILKQGISNQNDLFGRTKLVLGFRYKEWDRTAKKYQEVLKPYTNKVTTLKNSKEVKNYLDQL